MSAQVFHDTSPSEAEGLRLLQRHFARLEKAESRSDIFAVRTGSLLAGDDRATAYDPISYQTSFLLIAAFDHIGTFRRTVQDHGMPIVAAYPLLRAALESAAQVLWLTAGGRRTTRVFRALHRVWNGAVLSDEALRHLDADRPSTLPGLRARLDELLTSAKVQRSLDSPYPSMTDIVIDAGRRVPDRTLRPIDVWRLCSSMAHGNRSVSIAVLERRPRSSTPAPDDTYTVTTSYLVLAMFAEVLVDVIEAALDSLDRLNVIP